MKEIRENTNSSSPTPGQATQFSNFPQKRPIFALAPMDGYTNIAYRIFTIQHNNDLTHVFTEFVNVEAIFKAPEATLPLLYTNSEEQKYGVKVIAQIFGNSSQLKYFKLAVVLIKYLGFDGIDLNVGCPYKNIINSKAGSYLIGKKKQIRKIISAIKQGVLESDELLRRQEIQNIIKEYIDPTRKKLNLWDLPPKTNLTISLKTRLGHKRTNPKTWWEFLDSLGLDFITIHARTVEQMYSGKAKWKTLGKIRQHFKNTSVIGNGDIGTRISLSQALQITPAGIMIGRAFLGNPELKEQRSLKQQLELLYSHTLLALKYFPELQSYHAPFKKFVPWYLKGVPNSKKIKMQLLLSSNMHDFLNTIERTLVK